MSGAPPDPVFLFGFERSGTTLLTMMFGAHRRLCCPLSVTGTWWNYADRLSEYGELQRPEDIRGLVDDLAAHERLRLWNVPFDAAEIAAAVRPGCYADIVAGFHMAAARAEGKPRWVNMDIATLFAFERVVQLFPEARFVQIVRDPRDVAISFKGYRYGGLNAMEVAERWTRATVAADRIGAALGEERYRRIRYEDLILEPEPTLESACGFIGEAFSPAMLDYGGDVARKVPEDKRGLWPALAAPPQSDKVARWRREMKASEAYVVEEIAGEGLQRFGYEIACRSFSAGGELRGTWCYLTRGARLSRIRARF